MLFLDLNIGVSTHNKDMLAEAKELCTRQHSYFQIKHESLSLTLQRLEINTKFYSSF